MSNGILDNKIIVQIGVIVKDIEKACQEFSRIFELPMPNIMVTQEYENAKTEFRGNPTNARAKLAFYKFENIEIEFIEPDENPSTWREFLDNIGEGIHHIAFHIKGMKEKTMKLSNLGMPILQKGEYTGGRYAYIDSFDKLKFIIELLEND